MTIIAQRISKPREESLRVQKFEKNHMQQLPTVRLGFIWKVRL